MTKSNMQPPSLEPLLLLTKQAMARTNDVIIERLGSDVPLIPQLAGHLVAAGGKRMRPMLCLAGALMG
ncbi:MAG: polyprenyl synthetase family protein, partial [Alphaproteobacteria bacterium]|nr:polyprenyl synthetase family protein [Alphaproteobacteria bacterium]